MTFLTPDFAFLCGAALLGGAVRGFSGFGAALVFLPLAGRVLDPVSAVSCLILMELIGPLPMLPRVLPDLHRRDLARMTLGTVLALPLGVMLLSQLEASAFRGLVGVISLLMLTGLIAGWRYRGYLGPGLITGTGFASGFLGGAAGIPGPPVIFVYMASTLPARVIRANITTFLLIYDWLMLGLLALLGHLHPQLILTGLALTIPNMLGNGLGTALFQPEKERLFRAIAYSLIALSALTGLPIWG